MKKEEKKKNKKNKESKKKLKKPKRDISDLIDELAYGNKKGNIRKSKKILDDMYILDEE